MRSVTESCPWCHGIWFRAGKLCAGAGLLDEAGAARYTIHQLRHTTATELIEEGHKIETVQRRLGHKIFA